MKSIVLLLMISVSGVLAAANPPGVESNTPIKPYRYERFFIASKLTPEIMREFKAAGGETIIDVRDFSEHGECGEAVVAAKLGLKFYMSPLPKAEPFTDETFTAVEKIVEGAGKKPVLVSCSSGNRAAGFLAAHLVKKEKMAAPDAIRIAKNHGLNSSFMEEIVRDYLK